MAPGVRAAGGSARVPAGSPAAAGAPAAPAARELSAGISSADVDLLLRIGQVAGGAVDPRPAAVEVLRLVRDLAPYAAACLSAFNPVTNRHETIANVGYPQEVVDQLDASYAQHAESLGILPADEVLRLRAAGSAVEWQRLCADRRSHLPEGWTDGVSSCLYTADGRYTGSLHLSTEEGWRPDASAKAALSLLEPTLAGLTDTLRAPSWLASSMGPQEACALVSDEGSVVALPGRDLGRHLVPSGPLPHLVARLQRADPVPRRFLWRDELGHLLAVRTAPSSGGTVVTVLAAPRPHDLTARELEVLTLLALGRTNGQIGTALQISAGTVAKHVEHLLPKLGCASRSAAVARAGAEGLLLRPPPGLPLPTPRPHVV